MMTRKQRWWIEILIVCLVLVVLLTAVWPHFKRAQRSHALVLLFEDLDGVLTALTNYQKDHDGVPYSCQPTDALFGMHRMTASNSEPVSLSYVAGHWETGSFGQQCRFLVQEKYLKDIPLFLQHDFPFPQPHRIECAQLQELEQMPDRFRFINTGFALMWPLASVENNNRFSKDHAGESGFHFPNHKANLYDSLMKESYYYAPSNGLKSAGYVYLDCYGNHSPWGWEKPRLTILDTLLE